MIQGSSEGSEDRIKVRKLGIKCINGITGIIRSHDTLLMDLAMSESGFAMGLLMKPLLFQN